MGLVNLSNSEAVTLINTVPSAMEELVQVGGYSGLCSNDQPGGRAAVRGRWWTGSTPRAVAKVYDLYGPSEEYDVFDVCLAGEECVCNHGRPIANTQVYILDAARPAPADRGTR